jgi:hypothetical protein
MSRVASLKVPANVLWHVASDYGHKIGMYRNVCTSICFLQIIRRSDKISHELFLHGETEVLQKFRGKIPAELTIRNFHILFHIIMNVSHEKDRNVHFYSKNIISYKFWHSAIGSFTLCEQYVISCFLQVRQELIKLNLCCGFEPNKAIPVHFLVQHCFKHGTIYIHSSSI